MTTMMGHAGRTTATSGYLMVIQEWIVSVNPLLIHSAMMTSITISRMTFWCKYEPITTTACISRIA